MDGCAPAGSGQSAALSAGKPAKASWIGGFAAARGAFPAARLIRLGTVHSLPTGGRLGKAGHFRSPATTHHGRRASATTS